MWKSVSESVRQSVRRGLGVRGILALFGVWGLGVKGQGIGVRG